MPMGTPTWEVVLVDDHMISRPSHKRRRPDGRQLAGKRLPSLIRHRRGGDGGRCGAIGAEILLLALLGYRRRA